MILEVDLGDRIRGCAYEVLREPGGGSLKKVYGNALVQELGMQGLHASNQLPLAVRYNGQVVGQ